MSKILLSIKPEYAYRILSGEKKYEYRKRVALRNVSTIVIYVTFPVCKVLGEVQVVDTISSSPSAIWEKTKKDAGISREKFRKYFFQCKNAYAYCLGKVINYEHPKPLDMYNLKHAPQSFYYLDDNH